MNERPERPRASWMLRVFLPLFYGGYLVGMSVCTANGNTALGMSVGMGIGAVLVLVVGLVFWPREFRWRRRPPHGGVRHER